MPRQHNGTSRRALLGGAAALGVTAMMRSPASAAGDRPTALITGTSSGFGRLTALTLARKGHRVFASMRHTRAANAGARRELLKIATTEKLALEVVDIDIRSDRSVESGVRQVLRRAGHIDVLVNNAGCFYPALLETMSVDRVREVFDTNVFGHLRMNRAVLPSMRARRSGLVVQVTSGVGRIVLPFQGAYCGAKWASEALSEVARYEVAKHGIDVAIVEPGPYPTDLIDNAILLYREYLRDLGQDDQDCRRQYGELAKRTESWLSHDPGPDPQEVADVIATLVATPAGSRPPRTLVGIGKESLAPINVAHRPVQEDALRVTGNGDLIPAPRSTP